MFVILLPLISLANSNTQTKISEVQKIVYFLMHKYFSIHDILHNIVDQYF